MPLSPRPVRPPKVRKTLPVRRSVSLFLHEGCGKASPQRRHGAIFGHAIVGSTGCVPAAPFIPRPRIRETADTIRHPVGTCRMGSDWQPAVDLPLRAGGVEALRVADAFIMPLLFGGNTDIWAVMIAGRQPASSGPPPPELTEP